MRIYCCIDGTDNHDTSALTQACLTPDGMIGQHPGHVKRIAAFGFEAVKYFPGTTDSITGASSSSIINAAERWIEAVHNTKSTTPKQLYLGGFSRGGAAICVLAHRLKAKGIAVQEMFIFDAVDRSFAMDDGQTAIIPDNVTRAFHAMRHPMARSRESFGNCAKTGTKGNLEVAHFMTTHGGVGGWPNGASMVTPGFGAEDYAYVGQAAAQVAKNDPISLGLPGGVGRAAARTNTLAKQMVANDPRQNHIHEVGEPYPSMITPEQELQGMGSAWQWMYGRVFSTGHSGAGM